MWLLYFLCFSPFLHISCVLPKWWQNHIRFPDHFFSDEAVFLCDGERAGTVIPFFGIGVNKLPHLVISKYWSFYDLNMFLICFLMLLEMNSSVWASLLPMITKMAQFLIRWYIYIWDVITLLMLWDLLEIWSSPVQELHSQFKS